MPHSIEKLLFDAHAAANQILQYTHGKSKSEYAAESILRDAVERQFIIIGEALARLERFAPEVTGRIADSGKIIGFRNVLVHGYDVIDEAIVWSAIQSHLPALQQQLADLLVEYAGQ